MVAPTEVVEVCVILEDANRWRLFEYYMTWPVGTQMFEPLQEALYVFRRTSDLAGCLSVPFHLVDVQAPWDRLATACVITGRALNPVWPLLDGPP